MGMYNPKPYKKLNKKTGKWELVIPEPVDYKKELRQTTAKENQDGKINVYRSAQEDN